jgi:flavin-dependent dehydrogenase
MRLHILPKSIGEDQIRVGEASFALDPLSSTGVEKAMHSGLIAGTAIHTVLALPERASLCADFYRTRQDGGCLIARRLVDGFLWQGRPL